MQNPTVPTPSPVDVVAAGEVLRGALDVLGRAVHGQAHQQPLGLVRLVGRGTVEEVRRERDESLRGEPVGDVT